MKIAFFDTKTYDKQAFEEYNNKNGVEFKFFETKLNPDTADLTKGYDGVCVFVNDCMNAEVINTLYKNGIKFIALRCAGFNNVDLNATQNKIQVCRVPNYSPHAVAEHAMALLLTSIRRIHKAYIRTKDFNFSLNGFTGFDLHEKTVGIIGMGKIGSVFSDICLGFGMNVLAFDKIKSEESRAKFVSKEELFSQSDIISLHCPLTEETEYMINKKTINLMKKGVVIINTSRGGLIDTDELIEGIKSRKIGAACLDVYEEEADLFFEDNSGHIIEDDTLARLISMPNVIVTSHQAFLTKEALSQIAQITFNNILSYTENGKCDNLICCNK